MKNIKKLINEHFTQKDIFDEDEAEEDSLVKSSVDDIALGNIENISYEDSNYAFGLKSKHFPADEKLSCKVYAGKTVSRQSLGHEYDESSSDQEADSLIDSDNTEIKEENDHEKDIPDSDEDISSEESKSEDYDEDISLNNKKKNKKESEAEDSESVKSHSSHEESNIEDDMSETESPIVDHSSILYSKSCNENSEIEQGLAVRNQINLWEILLEGRIMLQKCLVASNQLPKADKYESIWFQFSQEDKNTLTECREKVWDLLEKLINLQNTTRRHCPEYSETQNKQTENENHSDDSEAENMKIKRRKLTEYPKILTKQYSDYIPFRNAAIQKWNDRTKVACGKFAKSNFSAFDQPVLKQIEQIMSDKHRLIERTCIKRSQYHIIGEEVQNLNENYLQGEKSEINHEIFDDDDFYHKFLRDYIERKTADVSDPTQLGKKWIKLQNLRNKMKKKIDTRRTKGRKIKYDIHPKLVNFMAPITAERWDDTTINDLCSSVFAKI